MARTTPATLALDRARVTYELLEYAYDPGGERVGLQAAEALGEDPARVLKTLMTLAGGKPVCVVLASDREVDMKALAAAVGAKAAEMMKPADAERMTGFKVGGISPFGQKRRVRTVVDAAALGQGTVYVNAGGRGLQARLGAGDLVAALGAEVAAVGRPG